MFDVLVAGETTLGYFRHNIFHVFDAFCIKVTDLNKVKSLVNDTCNDVVKKQYCQIVTVKEE